MPPPSPAVLLGGRRHNTATWHTLILTGRRGLLVAKRPTKPSPCVYQHCQGRAAQSSALVTADLGQPPEFKHAHTQPSSFRCGCEKI